MNRQSAGGEGRGGSPQAMLTGSLSFRGCRLNEIEVIVIAECFEEEYGCAGFE